MTCNSPVRLLSRLFLVFALNLSLTGFVRGALQADFLRADSMIESLAVESAQPLLTWQLKATDGLRNTTQVAYEIQAATTLDLLQQGHADLWNSGRVISDLPGRCRYAGNPVKSMQRVYWRVRVWMDANDPGPWAAATWFEAGLLENADWTGSWIGLDPHTRGTAAVYLRKRITLDKPVVAARAYVCGLGWNELYVNGRRIGDHVLDPAQTDYDKRCFYVPHDITDAVNATSNGRQVTVGVVLGDGWFSQDRVWGKWMSYGEPRLWAQFVFFHSDGTQTVVATDPTWEGRTGPIVADNVYAGEEYDARKELGDWCSSKAGSEGWVPSIVENPLTTRMVPQTMPPVRCIREIPTKAVHQISPGKWVYDFGENVSGWARLHINAGSGAQIHIRFAEAIAPDGSLDTASTGVAATGVDEADTYTAKGDPAGETWQPRFTVHGFQYAELTVTGGKLLAPPVAGTLKCIVLHTDFQMTGSFASSDDQLNRIHAMAVRTLLANDLGVPSDCPARERCGWTGDAHAVVKYELDNTDSAAFFRKYIRDLQTGATTNSTAQMAGWGFEGKPVTLKFPAGLPYMIAPGKRQCDVASPDWGCAIVLVPWQLYAKTGDLGVLQEFRHSMEIWADFQLSRREPDGMIRTGLGDWCSPTFNRAASVQDWIGTKEVPITSTGQVIRALTLLSHVEKLCGDPARSDQYGSAARQMTTKWLDLFFKPADLPARTQTALAFGVALADQPARRREIFAALSARVDGGREFDTGIFGTSLVLRELSEAGQSQAARRLLTKPQMPSYRAIADLGATTLWECWPIGKLTGFSLSHPMQGGFDAWLYEDVAGLAGRPSGDAPWQFRWTDDPDLSWATASEISPLGLIASAWKKADGLATWTVRIPPGSDADVEFPDLPNGAIQESGKPIEGASWLSGQERHLDGLSPRVVLHVGSGDYQFTFRPLAH